VLSFELSDERDNVRKHPSATCTCIGKSLIATLVLVNSLNTRRTPASFENTLGSRFVSVNLSLGFVILWPF
jgi:hypothetical protein